MDFATFSEAVPATLNTRSNVEKIMRREYAAGLWKNLIKKHVS
jgi:hypothetical protein